MKSLFCLVVLILHGFGLDIGIDINIERNSEMPDAYPVLSLTSTSTTGLGSLLLETANLTTAQRTPKQCVEAGSLVDGDVVHVLCIDSSVTGQASFERFEGVYNNDTDEVSRVTVYDSTNGPGNKINWGVGTRAVLFVGIVDPGKIARLDRANEFSDPIHIKTGESGGTAQGGVADLLVLESEFYSGMQFLSKNPAVTTINFGDDADQDRFEIRANASSGILALVSNDPSGVIALEGGGQSLPNLVIRNNGAVHFQPRASAPSSPIDGDMYYDSTTNKFVGRANGAWVDFH